MHAQQVIAPSKIPTDTSSDTKRMRPTDAVYIGSSGNLTVDLSGGQANVFFRFRARWHASEGVGRDPGQQRQPHGTFPRAAIIHAAMIFQPNGMGRVSMQVLRLDAVCR